MIPVVISGIGHTSALGQGLDGLRRAWLDHATPAPAQEIVKTAKGDVPVAVLRAPQMVMPPKLLPEAVERRMSRFSKMCFVTVAEALTDAGAMHVEDQRRTGMVVGSAFSSLDLANSYQRRILADGAPGASPSLFAASIHNSLAAQLTLAFAIKGPNSTVATMEQTAIGSLRLAYDWIQSGMADRVAVLMGDELSEYHLYYFAQLDGSWIAGEGSVCLILEREDLAKKKYARMNAPQMTAAADAPRVFHSGAAEQTHGHLYGGTLMGAAFEITIAVLRVEREGGEIACVQACRGLPPQSVVLGGV